MTGPTPDEDARSANAESGERKPRPLDGIRVVELGQILAGPLASSLLAWFGAEVIKVEPPGSGDPIRTWRVLEDGTSLWWRSLSRNKKLVSIDLRKEEGRQLVRELILQSDVLIENFRPGTLERWNLDPAELRRLRPDLVVTRISGYGQTGPYREQGGFASVCEAFGGLRFITGHPGEAPVRSNASIGDSLAAFQAVIGTLVALLRRERTQAGTTERDWEGAPGGTEGAREPEHERAWARARGRGDVVDVAIYEAVLSVLEGAIPEFQRCGVIRQPSGSTITGIVPSDAYRCSDGQHVVIGANSDSSFRRLMIAVGRKELGEDAGLATNELRVQRRAEIDDAISKWTVTLPSADVLAQLAKVAVPAGPVNTIQDVMEDPHVAERQVWEEVASERGPYFTPRHGPLLEEAPGMTESLGGDIGEHTREILQERLGLEAEDVEELETRGIIQTRPNA